MRFAGARERRTTTRSRSAGWRRRCGGRASSAVTFELEPVAAAYGYQQRLDHDELVLIGDFGGGTSDFTLVRLGPAGSDGPRRRRGGARRRRVRRAPDPARRRARARASARSDARPSARCCRSRCGSTTGWSAGSSCRSSSRARPASCSAGSRTRRSSPRRSRRWCTWWRTTSASRCTARSSARSTRCRRSDAAEFRFADGADRAGPHGLARAAFEGWIAPEVDAIAACVDGLLAASGARARRRRDGVPHRRLVVRARGAARLRGPLRRASGCAAARS